MAIADSTLSGDSGVFGALFNLSTSLSVGGSGFAGNVPDDIEGGYTDLGGNNPIIT